MPIFSATTVGSALAAFIILTPAAVAGADEPPPYASATEAYRQGASAMKSGEMASAVPALEYAAKRGVLGAQLKLARLYASGQRRAEGRHQGVLLLPAYRRSICGDLVVEPDRQICRRGVRRAWSVLRERHPGDDAAPRSRCTPSGCSAMRAPISAMPKRSISSAGSISPARAWRRIRPSPPTGCPWPRASSMPVRKPFSASCCGAAKASARGRRGASPC